MKNFHCLLPLFLVLLVQTGCTSPRLERELKDRPFGFIYVPKNIYAADYLPAEVQVVAVLPFSTTRDNVLIPDEVEMAMIRSLRKEGRFEVAEIRSEDIYRLMGKTRIPLQEGLPEELVSYLQERYGADAILQTEITAFNPYKPMAIGVHSRLFNIPNGDILWSCDEVFDSGNERVVMGARKYSESELDQPFPLQTSYSTLLSPQRFAAYVGWTLYHTLPVREVNSE